MRLALGAVVLAMLAFALRGRRVGEPALELRFPLAGGTFHVAQAGASKVINHHFWSASQRYASGHFEGESRGTSATRLYPEKLDRYAIWGSEVRSPCDGTVAAAVYGLPDRTPPDRDPENRAGNYVALECQGATVYLAHLLKDSVRVRPGDAVRAGELVARVGNSGNTTEPHLHIHAEKGSYPGRFSGRPGIPIRFGRRFLVRNDRVVSAAEAAAI